MNIRTYTAADRQACFDIFDSNCPPYFDPHERDYLVNWLDHQGTVPKMVTYKNAKADHFYVLETDKGVIGCGGFYITTDGKHANMVWGMVHNAEHKKGYGTALYTYREGVVKELYPDATIVLDTSQYTYGFFEKLGKRVTKITDDGYGPGLNRYDME